MPRRPNLTHEEKCSLYGLRECTGRPDAATPKLVALGFAVAGAARYGQWVKITETGKLEIASWSEEGRHAVARGYYLDLALNNDVHPDLKRYDVDEPISKRPPPASNLQPRSAAARRETTKATKPVRSPDVPVAPSIPSTPLRQGPAKQRSLSKPAAAEPNAVRVTTGKKVTYYPLSNYDSLNGQKERVRTSNKPFRSYSLEASAADTVVP